jgi:hypothetical protein
MRYLIQIQQLVKLLVFLFYLIIILWPGIVERLIVKLKGNIEFDRCGVIIYGLICGTIATIAWRKKKNKIAN